MPPTLSYPGVYIQELSSAVHSITGVATSIAAFVGYTARGIDNRAQEIFSFSDYQRLFGGLASNSELSYAVQQFFQNGGSQAYVVRTPMAYPVGAVVYASVHFGVAATDGLTVTALSSGTWANGQLLVDIDAMNLDLSTATGDPLAFNLTVTNLADGTVEYFPAVTLNSAFPNYVVKVINDEDNGSQLVSVTAGTASPLSPLKSTGIVGKSLNNAAVNTALGGGTIAAADAFLGIQVPTTPAKTITVKVLSKNSPIPQTLQGLAGLLQRAINSALAVSLPGASVACSVVPLGTDKAIRVNMLVPNQPDATITFVPPSSLSPVPAGNDAANGLALIGGVSNVAHYALGTGSPAGGNLIAATAATKPSGLPTDNELIGDQALFTGIYALNKVDLFNLLCIPDATRSLASDTNTLDTGLNPATIYAAAISLCSIRRALLIIDPPPNVHTVSAAVDWKSNTIGVVDPNGAAFFPRLRLADPLNKGLLRTFAPCGVVAGVYATTDTKRGIWKAPAGIEATLNGVQSMTYQLSDGENGVLNPLGLNCFRTFPLYGPVLWGARTLVGADALTNQWKYVPVRRTALYLEESLYRGMKWVVFEPNDEPLWASIRLNVGAFMQSLFLKGAFQGQTPAQAYFVKCDSETTTQTDIDAGIVNVLVGFAPLKPAEFVVISIEQLTGQTLS